MVEFDGVSQVPRSAEDRWTQLRAAIQQAQGQSVEDAYIYGVTQGANGLSSLRTSLQLRPGSNFGPDADNTRADWALTRTRSAVRGPITDNRGLGTLAPYVLPGLLRRASGGIQQRSALQIFPSQRFSDNFNHQVSEARPFTAPGAQQQQQQLLQPGKHPQILYHHPYKYPPGSSHVSCTVQVQQPDPFSPPFMTHCSSGGLNNRLKRGNRLRSNPQRKPAGALSTSHPEVVRTASPLKYGLSSTA